ncbi:histidine phosphatase family protein [Erwinia sp. CGal63]|uniref:histidine phosphatase family protein n=1 Tax=Erwinia sp. CGal63 TaxID=2919889 RepID=UPI0030095BAD
MIVLVRHATPKIDYSRCCYRTARERLNDYDQTREVDEQEIQRFFASPVYQNIGNKELRVYSSPTGRAERTCQLLFHAVDDYVTEPNLKEVSLSIFPVPLLKMKVRSWFLLSRLAWLAGFSREKERARHAVQRAVDFFPVLEENENVAIVSHGYFMHYLKKELRKNRYRQGEIFREGCFTVEVWDK